MYSPFPFSTLRFPASLSLCPNKPQRTRSFPEQNCHLRPHQAPIASETHENPNPAHSLPYSLGRAERRGSGDSLWTVWRKLCREMRIPKRRRVVRICKVPRKGAGRMGKIINAGKYWALAVVEDQKGEGGGSERRRRKVRREIKLHSPPFHGCRLSAVGWMISPQNSA